MNQRYFVGITSCALVLAACGGGGGGDGGGSVAPSASPSSILGTVPGTRIEAFGDNGSYYVVTSTDNGSSEHPFELELPPGIGFHIVMTTNEGNPEQVIAPIGFRDSTGDVLTRIALGVGERIDLGHVPLHMSRNAAAAEDLDDDGVLDGPLVLDDVGANNPLLQSDSDDDGVDDYNDPDHGGYQYSVGTLDPQDYDDDGIPNVYDSDHVPGANDPDGDGLPDPVDVNPRNEAEHDDEGIEDDCDNDGYHDEDRNHDGFYDDDKDRDGYHDDDLDHDGRHDDDGEADGEESICTGGFAPTPTPDPVPTPTPVPTPLDGQALYNDHCSNCHGNPGRFAGISASGIENAIAGVSAMNFLSTLSAEEVAAIADYFATL